MTSPTTVEVLKKARALLEKGWCQEFGAMSADGAPRSPQAKDAVCFCLWGALSRAAGPDTIDNDDFQEANHFLVSVEGDYVIWNDRPGRTQSEVLDLMDRAIALASEKEAGHVG